MTGSGSPCREFHDTNYRSPLAVPWRSNDLQIHARHDNSS